MNVVADDVILDPAAGQGDAAFYAARRTAAWRRRPLSPGLRILFWSLRIYVFAMLGVVGIVLLRLA